MSDQEEKTGPKAGEIAGVTRQQMSDFLQSKIKPTGCSFCGSMDFLVHASDNDTPYTANVPLLEERIYTLKFVYLTCRNCSALSIFHANALTALVYGLAVEDSL